MEFTIDDIVIESKVRIKFDAEDIMRKENNWSDKMKESIGKIVVVKYIVNNKQFKGISAELNEDYEEEVDLLSFIKIMPEIYTWNFECIDEIIETPPFKNTISLGEVIDLMQSKDLTNKFLKNVFILNEKNSLYDMKFHISILEKQLPEDINRILRVNGYRLDPKEDLDNRIDVYKKTLKDLEDRRKGLNLEDK